MVEQPLLDDDGEVITDKKGILNQIPRKEITNEFHWDKILMIIMKKKSNHIYLILGWIE